MRALYNVSSEWVIEASNNRRCVTKSLFGLDVVDDLWCESGLDASLTPMYRLFIKFVLILLLFFSK